jgi:hypothetical protein
MKTGGRTKLRHNGVLPGETARAVAITRPAQSDIFFAPPPPATVVGSQFSVVSVLIRNTLPNADRIVYYRLRRSAERAKKYQSGELTHGRMNAPRNPTRIDMPIQQGLRYQSNKDCKVNPIKV